MPGYARSVKRALLATTLTAAALVATPAATAQAPSVPPDAAAVVGAAPIPIATVDHWVAIAGRQSKEKRSALVKEVMEFLITAEWVHAEAAERGLVVTPAEVRADFDKTRKASFKTNKEFERFLSESGQTVDDILFRVESGLLSDKLREDVTRDVRKPTEAQARSYYRQHKRSFDVPRRHEALVVGRSSKRAAQRVLDAVRAGSSWRSQKAERLLAQDLPLPRLAWHIRNARRGVPAGPVKSLGQWFVFELRRILPGRERTYAQARADVRSTMFAEAQEAALGRFVQDFHGHWKAQTVCRRAYAISDCGTILD